MRQPFEQHTLTHPVIEHDRHALVELRKHAIQHIPLWNRAWKTIEDKAMLTIWQQQPFAHHTNRHFIRHQSARIHRAAHETSYLGLQFHVLTKQIATRDVRQIQMTGQ